MSLYPTDEHPSLDPSSGPDSHTFRHMNEKDLDIHSKLDSITRKIKPLDLRVLVTNIFEGFGDLLDHLDLLEACLLNDGTLLKSHLLFKFTNARAQVLIRTIEREARGTEGATEALASLLDCTVFAINHELNKVSDLFIPGNVDSIEELRSEVTRAHSILRNCFQQSVVSIGLVFDPAVSSTALFDDFREKLEQSVILVEALTILADQAIHAEATRDLDTYFTLIEGLKMFSQGYMSYLIYSDWAEFEKFSDKISGARSEYDLWPILHQFARYMETLIGHVRLRAVFQDQVVRQDTTMEVAYAEVKQT